MHNITQFSNLFFKRWRIGSTLNITTSRPIHLRKRAYFTRNFNFKKSNKKMFTVTTVVVVIDGGDTKKSVPMCKQACNYRWRFLFCIFLVEEWHICLIVMFFLHSFCLFCRRWDLVSALRQYQCIFSKFLLIFFLAERTTNKPHLENQ